MALHPVLPFLFPVRGANPEDFVAVHAAAFPVSLKARPCDALTIAVISVPVTAVVTIPAVGIMLSIRITAVAVILSIRVTAVGTILSIPVIAVGIIPAAVLEAASLVRYVRVGGRGGSSPNVLPVHRGCGRFMNRDHSSGRCVPFPGLCGHLARMEGGDPGHGVEASHLPGYQPSSEEPLPLAMGLRTCRLVTSFVAREIFILCVGARHRGLQPSRHDQTIFQ
mmetsp:Transcript_3403/g.8351  ORF Transcript_3403/g.8351 Transcript_3403/m.8351 type:complete len:223 (-) Transcript_3403:198-866(-)